ncbi:putative protein kinase [Trypanosoma grayi]|uniref:putative protein kinase n=1 Tax=Trypanosoma grayi TaxID=71804 RepID=UPI0004F4B3B9|nr:putative protein kinase [Trypanosoma grayi]KEG10988.1 putative protein kinase [Trypanosoma grayi]
MESARGSSGDGRPSTLWSLRTTEPLNYVDTSGATGVAGEQKVAPATALEAEQPIPNNYKPGYGTNHDEAKEKIPRVLVKKMIVIKRNPANIAADVPPSMDTGKNNHYSTPLDEEEPQPQKRGTTTPKSARSVPSGRPAADEARDGMLLTGRSEKTETPRRQYASTISFKSPSIIGEKKNTDQMEAEPFSGSPIFHRGKRLAIPPPAMDDDVDRTSVPFPLPRPAPLESTDSSSSTVSSEEQGDDLSSNRSELFLPDVSLSLTSQRPAYGIVDVRETDSSRGPSPNDLPSSLVAKMQHLLNASPTHLHRESGETAASIRTPSPVPVTLLGAGRHYRQKHLKRVSYYILGPLLGEGVFGVVRDAIDTSASHMIPPRFERVAIKSFKYRRASAAEPADIAAAIAASTRGSVKSPGINTPPVLARAPLLDFKQRHDAKMRRLLDNEARNLQRFHCPNIIRSSDIFTRHGRDYIVLPIAICNLENLVRERVRQKLLYRQRQTRNAPYLSLHLGQGESLCRDASPSSELYADASGVSYMSLGESDFMLKNGLVADGTASLFSASLVRGIMYQLFNGVAYLHRQGLAHNDLKLQNILLFADGVLKIGDLGGLSEEYNDQGTPMYMSPELCRYFYCAGDVTDTKKVVTVNALQNDMWSCGVILYYLLVGKPLWGSGFDRRNKYQLYRAIAAQHNPIDVGHVPEPWENEMEMGVRSASGMAVTSVAGTPASISSSSLRHLLSRLLDVNPDTRLTAEEALLHPALQPPNACGASSTGVFNTVQHDVAWQVLESPHVQALIKRDREQHLQFVAACCDTLGIEMPEEIFLPETGSIGSDTDPINNGDEQVRESACKKPRGTVDRKLFLTEAERHYYEKKLGKAEYDVPFILTNPAKVKMMRDYLYGTVLVECGYRSIEEAESERVQELEKNQRILAAAEARATRKPPRNTSQVAGNSGKTSTAKSKNSNINNNSSHKEKEYSKCLCGLM